MEIFEIYFEVDINQTDLKELLSIKNLPELCNSINTVISDEVDTGVIYCIWGQHEIKREVLNQGIRFYFNQCPYILSIFITTENKNEVCIRCTSKIKIIDIDFLESLREFMDDWVSGISSFNHAHAQVSHGL